MPDIAGNAPNDEAPARPLGRAAALAFGAGLLFAALAGVALWAREGSDVFLAQAFAALAACF